MAGNLAVTCEKGTKRQRKALLKPCYTHMLYQNIGKRWRFYGMLLRRKQRSNDAANYFKQIQKELLRNQPCAVQRKCPAIPYKCSSAWETRQTNVCVMDITHALRGPRAQAILKTDGDERFLFLLYAHCWKKKNNVWRVLEIPSFET